MQGVPSINRQIVFTLLELAAKLRLHCMKYKLDCHVKTCNYGRVDIFTLFVNLRLNFLKTEFRQSWIFALLLDYNVGRFRKHNLTAARTDLKPT